MELTDAERAERERDIAEHMAERTLSRFEADALYYGSRLLIRLLRIACGAALAVVSLFWPLDHATTVLDRPMVSISILDLGSGLVAGAFGIWLLWVACIWAFGRGVTRLEWDASREGSLRFEVENGWHRDLEDRRRARQP